MSCPTCRRLDEKELREMAERSKLYPIWGTDLSPPLSEVLNKIRNDIAQIRGSVNDVMFAYPNWKERIDYMEGLLTAAIIALHHSVEERRKVENDQS